MDFWAALPFDQVVPAKFKMGDGICFSCPPQFRFLSIKTAGMRASKRPRAQLTPPGPAPTIATLKIFVAITNLMLGSLHKLAYSPSFSSFHNQISAVCYYLHYLTKAD